MPSPLTWVALAAAGLGGWAAWRNASRRRAIDHSHAKTQALHTWEGEGGGLPNGGPHVALVDAPQADPAAASIAKPK